LVGGRVDRRRVFGGGEAGAVAVGDRAAQAGDHQGLGLLVGRLRGGLPGLPPLQPEGAADDQQERDEKAGEEEADASLDQALPRLADGPLGHGPRFSGFPGERFFVDRVLFFLGEPFQVDRGRFFAADEFFAGGRSFARSGFAGRRFTRGRFAFGGRHGGPGRGGAEARGGPADVPFADRHHRRVGGRRGGEAEFLRLAVDPRLAVLLRLQ